MNYSDYYNEAFKKYLPLTPPELSSQVLPYVKGQVQFVRESKDKFLPDKSWRDLKILELGSGMGGTSLELAMLGAKVTIADFSDVALELAAKLYSHHGISFKSHLVDLTLPEPGFNETFDIIIDGHLLHCLTEPHERSNYYQLVREHLDSAGIFICETMVHKKKIFIPENFKFDEDTYTLFQFLGSWKPVRKIIDSLDLEQEIQTNNLKIKSFFYYSQMGMVPHHSFMDLPTEILPAAVRMVLAR
ncbi:MAG TPA: class I SAM-dependent methyltransferase [Bacteriovoracaceae bacterium]|nr:class I SAM-dependent methyltransferase [Bacteriovoracaceae bacterium]